MRRAGYADEAEAGGDGGVGVDGEGAADVDGADGDAVDDGTGGEGAGGGVEVWRVEELRVVVVCGAGAAEAAAAAHDGGVGHEEGGGVIGSRDGHGGELAEGVGDGVEKFGGELGGGVGEGLGGDLAADDEDGAIGEDDAVGEGTLIGHVRDCLHVRNVGRLAHGDDVGVRGGVGVLIVDCAAHCEDIASDSIVHGSVAAHGIGVSCAGSCADLRATIVGAVPVHGDGRAGLEDIAVRPAEEPAVVVGSIDTCSNDKHKSAYWSRRNVP